MASYRISRRRFLASGLAVSLADLTARAAPAADGFLTLEAAPATLRLLPEPAAETPVLAYNGAVPGPLLRYKKGEEVRVRLVNRLDQPTSLAWPGVRIINAMDGVGGLTQAPVAPGEAFEYRFTPPDSGLFAYRPGTAPFAGEQLGRGLYGALIVDEADPPAADRDMLAIIAEWRLDQKGAIAADASGGLLTLNSKPLPLAETAAPGARIRLRLVSAAARVMWLSFEGVRPLILALDGQPADSAFEPAPAMPLGPGARLDIMFDLPRAAGAKARLVLKGGPGGGKPGEAADAIVFTTEGEARPAAPPIAALGRNPALPAAIRLQDAKRAELIIAPAPGGPAAFTLNGAAADRFSDQPLLAVKRGAPAALALSNRTALIQQFHLHGHAMRLLHDLDDGWDPYWRDSVLVAPGRTKHVAFVADNPGKWAIETTTGLSAWFLVT